MAMKALLEGSAGKYQIRGAIWELGSFTYRAYLHLVPTGQRPNPAGSVVSASGTSVQEVLGAAKEQVKSTTGTPVEKLALVHREGARAGARYRAVSAPTIYFPPPSRSHGLRPSPLPSHSFV